MNLHFKPFLDTKTSHRYLRFTLEADKNIHISPSQYHGCRCPGDVRSQGISSHGINQGCSKYSRPFMYRVAVTWDSLKWTLCITLSCKINGRRITSSCTSFKWECFYNQFNYITSGRRHKVMYKIYHNITIINFAGADCRERKGKNSKSFIIKQ